MKSESFEEHLFAARLQSLPQMQAKDFRLSSAALGRLNIYLAFEFYLSVRCVRHAPRRREYFIRHAVAHDICAMIEYKSIPVSAAVQEMIAEKLASAGVSGGLIAMDSKANIAVDYNTEGMFYGYIKRDGTITVNVCNMIIE